jgi:aminopeptidase N
VDDSVAGRQFAARQLGKQGGHLAVQALEEAVRADRFWGVKAAAAKALGAVRTPEARDALLRCRDVRHLKARRAVVAALGEFHGDESVLAAIEPIARSGPSWFVEAEAHRSAGRLRLPASFDLLVAGMARQSFRQLIRVGCVDGFVELRDERGFEHLSAAARYGAPHQSRAAAVGALARLGLFFDARRKALGEEIARYLDDPDFRVRIAAANALRTLEDPSRAADLDTMAARELDGRAVRVAREAALTLRKGATTSDEVKHLREEFEQLRDENAKLRGRLERVEGASAAERRPANKRRLYSE